MRRMDLFRSIKVIISIPILYCLTIPKLHRAEEIFRIFLNSNFSIKINVWTICIQSPISGDRESFEVRFNNNPFLTGKLYHAVEHRHFKLLKTTAHHQSVSKHNEQETLLCVANSNVLFIVKVQQLILKLNRATIELQYNLFIKGNNLGLHHSIYQKSKQQHNGNVCNDFQID